jgi:DNA-binding GntR family transcriptional regulator
MQIIEALERRDTELAERLVRDHSLNLARYVEKYCDYLD